MTYDINNYLMREKIFNDDDFSIQQKRTQEIEMLKQKFNSLAETDSSFRQKVLDGYDFNRFYDNHKIIEKTNILFKDILGVLKNEMERRDPNQLDKSPSCYKFNFAIISGITDSPIFYGNQNRYCRVVVDKLENARCHAIEIGGLKVLNTNLEDSVLKQQESYFNHKCILVLEDTIKEDLYGDFKAICLNLAANFDSHIIYQCKYSNNAELITYMNNEIYTFYKQYYFELNNIFFNPEIEIYYGDYCHQINLSEVRIDDIIAQLNI